MTKSKAPTICIASQKRGMSYCVSVSEDGDNGLNNYELEFVDGKFKSVRVHHNGEYVGGFFKESDTLTRAQQMTDKHLFNAGQMLCPGEVRYFLGTPRFHVRMMNEGESQQMYMRHSYLVIDTTKDIFIVGTRIGGRACFAYGPDTLSRVSFGANDDQTPVLIEDGSAQKKKFNPNASPEVMARVFDRRRR